MALWQVHAALGPSFPVDVTEYNTLAGSSFEKTTQTMDTAQQVSGTFGALFAAEGSTLSDAPVHVPLCTCYNCGPMHGSIWRRR